MTLKFASDKCKSVILKPLDFRVPLRGELYLGKNGKVYRLKEDRVQSRRAEPRLILIESKTSGATAK